MTTIRQVPATDARALRQFISLERTLVGAHPRYISDIDSDILKRLTGKSAFCTDMDQASFIASHHGRDVARCTAMINRRYQQAKGEAVGFIGYFTAAADADAATRGMLSHAEHWLRERGVTRVIAPFNGAAVLGMGVLTDAFDEEPIFPGLWQPPHVSQLLRGAGYHPNYPLWYFTVDFASPQYRAAVERVRANAGVRVRPVNKKQWHDDLVTFFTTLGVAFEDEWEFHPMRPDEIHEFFDPMKLILDTRQMLIAEVDGQPAGVVLGFPDWTPLFRSFKGKVGPWQLLRLMLRANRYERAGLIAIGALSEFRGRGVAEALAVNLYRYYEARGLKEAFYYPVNEVNTRSRKFAEKIGGRGRVLYHCYDKTLH